MIKPVETKKVLFVGPLLSESGYGEHARSVFSQLLACDVELFVELSRWGATPDMIPSAVKDGQLIAALVNKTANLKGKIPFDLSVQVCLPSEVKPLARENILSTAAVESLPGPAEWAETTKIARLIHVPSEFSASVLVSAGIPREKVVVDPLSILEHEPSQSFLEKLDSELGSFEQAILLAGSWLVGDVGEDRKGLDQGVISFCKTFRGRQDVCLLIKTQIASADDPADQAAVVSRVRYLQGLSGVSKEKMPPVRVLKGYASKSEMSALMSHPKVKTLLAPTRGEGFGLLIAEAWASGMNVVATFWSGHLDYLCTKTKNGFKPKLGFFPVQLELTKIPERLRGLPWFSSNSRWASPLSESLSIAMLEAVKASRSGKRSLAQSELASLLGLPKTTLESVTSRLQQIQSLFGARVAVVSDFSPEEGRGAELTLSELIEDSGLSESTAWVSSAELVSGSFSTTALDGKLILVANASLPKDFWVWLIQTGQTYVLVEFDYRWSPKRNPIFDQMMCTPLADSAMWREIYDRSQAVFYMSEEQRQVTERAVGAKRGVVVGSYVSWVAEGDLPEPAPQQSFWAYWNSSDPIKGASKSKEAIAQLGGIAVPFDKLDAAELKQLLVRMEGFSLAPLGYDTDPRILYEAVACGCKLALGEYVQGNASKFTRSELVGEMSRRLSVFREAVDALTPRRSVSWYSTAHNCISFGYDFAESLKSIHSSLLEQDEICVLDLGSDDGTYEALVEFAADHPRLRVARKEVDRSTPNWGIEMHKGDSRELCLNEVLVQFDLDEVLPAGHLDKLIQSAPRGPHVMAPPMLEFWGSRDKVRVDYNPFKPRISTAKRISHGAPDGSFYEKDGVQYIKNGRADGCEFIVAKDIRVPAPVVSPAQDPVIAKVFRTQLSLLCKATAKIEHIEHHSWLDLEKKLKQTRATWSKIHSSRYGLSETHNAHFPGKRWDEVSDAEIAERALVLARGGSRMFHQELDSETLIAPAEI